MLYKKEIKIEHGLIPVFRLFLLWIKIEKVLYENFYISNV